AILTAVAPPRVTDLYGVGTFVFRWAVVLAGIHHHFMYMAFAIVISVLCAPYFLPSVLYREAFRYGPELFITASAAFVLRLAGYLAISGLLTAALVIYIAWKSLRQKAIPLKPP
ncbi:MAG: hypothetical protein ACK4M3_04480, partial [Pyrobaculum sp.]